MNKKLLRGLSVSAIALSLFACGGSGNPSSESKPSSENTSSEVATSEETKKAVALDKTAKQTKDAGDKVIESKKELGDRYGMSTAQQGEWYVQAANFEAYVVGKTAAEVIENEANYKSNYNKEGTVEIAGCSISPANFISSLKTITDTKSFTATGDVSVGAGTVALDIDSKGVLTFTVAGVVTGSNNTVLESSINCYQVPLAVTADEAGAEIDTSKKQASTDTIASNGVGDSQVVSKRELQDKYGMGNTETGVQEWYVQADNFSTYAKGKDASTLAGLNYQSHYNPEGTEVVTGCTISCGDFGKAIAEAGSTLKTAPITAAENSSYKLKFGSSVKLSKPTQLEVSVGAFVVDSEDKIVAAYFDVTQAPLTVA